MAETYQVWLNDKTRERVESYRKDFAKATGKKISVSAAIKSLINGTRSEHLHLADLAGAHFVWSELMDTLAAMGTDADDTVALYTLLKSAVAHAAEHK